MIETPDTTYTVHRYPTDTEKEKGGCRPPLFCYCQQRKFDAAATNKTGAAATTTTDTKSSGAGAGAGAGADTKTQCLSVPLYSLYGKTRIPSAEQLATFDTFVVDLQDIGCRVYTFMYTLANCLRAAAAASASASAASAAAAATAAGGLNGLSGTRKQVIVLDRPNPCGLTEIIPIAINEGEPKTDYYYSAVNGDRMTESLRTSFVGLYDLPFQHGLTLGGTYCVFVLCRD